MVALPDSQITICPVERARDSDGAACSIDQMGILDESAAGRLTSGGADGFEKGAYFGVVFTAWCGFDAAADIYAPRLHRC